MKHFGGFKPDTLFSIVNWVGIPLIILYVFSMLLYPWLNGGWEWENVQNIWYSWQSLNVGMLAFLSSVVALNISRYNAIKQRDREFIAAKAFLPESLSELIVYFKQCARILIEAWPKVKDPENYIRGPIESILPEPPAGYKEYFRDCIKFAEYDVAERLAFILMRFQIHRARITGFVDMFKPESELIPTKGNALNYFYDLAQLQALVSKLFPYARGMEEFDPKLPSYDDFINAYNNLDMWLDDYEELVNYTEERCNT